MQGQVKLKLTPEQWEAINKAGIIEELTLADTEGEAEILLAQIYPSVAIGDGDPGVIVAGIIDHNNAAKIIRYLDPKGYKRQVMNGDIEPWPDEVDQLRAALAERDAQVGELEAENKKLSNQAGVEAIANYAAIEGVREYIAEHDRLEIQLKQKNVNLEQQVGELVEALKDNLQAMEATSSGRVWFLENIEQTRAVLAKHAHSRVGEG